jgi:peptidyl-prolyl cis-trans isomerase D
MLLSMMRRHAKSWLIKFLVGIIAAVFIFYFGYSFHSREGTRVATVNGDPITGVEYQKAYRSMLEALQREYKSVWSESLVKVFNVKDRALEVLINQKLLSQEARNIGFDVTEKEVQDQILFHPAFQSRGRFDEARYRTLLLNNHMTPEDFEAGIAQETLQRKMEQFLGCFVPVTDQDVLDYFTFTNEKVKLGFVQFLPERFKGSVTVGDAALENYFQEQKEKYRIPEKIRVAYVLFDPEDYRNQVRMTDQQIRDTYEERLSTFKEPKQVRVRHILFKLEQDATEEKEKEVRAKASAVLEKARQGEDFAELAKKYSEDPSKNEGGDLGYFGQGEMVKPVEDVAFKMKKGEISDLVRSPFGYHILKVEDVKEARTKPLEEVQDQIAKSLTDTTMKDLAHEKALSFLDQMPYQTDLSPFASEHGVKARESGYFSLDEPIPDVGDDQKLKQSLFSLQKGETSEVFEAEGKFYIFQVSDRRPSAVPSLEQVRERVKEDLTANLAAQEAKAAAEKFLMRLKAGEDWNALAKENGLEPKITDFFSRQNPASELGYDQRLLEEAFGLGEKNRYPDKVFEGEKGVFVIRYEARQGIDKEKYEADKESYRNALVQARLRLLSGQWLQGLRKKAEIEILLPADKERSVS